VWLEVRRLEGDVIPSFLPRCKVLSKGRGNGLASGGSKSHNEDQGVEIIRKTEVAQCQCDLHITSKVNQWWYGFPHERASSPL
jgi:hypothetical protein